jgi:DNA-binding MarR family transcriptional regulator
MISGKLNICAEELKGAAILDVNILRLLHKRPELIPKEIAGELGIPNSTLTHAISRLEKKGLLERKLNASDLRSLQLLLTDMGRQAILGHHEEERKLISRIADLLDETETALLLRVLTKLAQQL